MATISTFAAQPSTRIARRLAPPARAMRTFFVVASPARASRSRSPSVVRAFLCERV